MQFVGTTACVSLSLSSIQTRADDARNSGVRNYFGYAHCSDFSFRHYNIPSMIRFARSPKYIYSVCERGRDSSLCFHMIYITESIILAAAYKIGRVNYLIGIIKQTWRCFDYIYIATLRKPDQSYKLATLLQRALD